MSDTTLDLKFVDGRATVDLADGNRLSILSPDRQVFIDEVVRNAPTIQLLDALAAALGLPEPSPDPGKVHADAHTFEVALIKADDDDEGPGRTIPGWDEYVIDRLGGWTTYGYVPPSVIEEYIEQIGRA